MFLFAQSGSLIPGMPAGEIFNPPQSPMELGCAGGGSRGGKGRRQEGAFTQHPPRAWQLHAASSFAFLFHHK